MDKCPTSNGLIFDPELPVTSTSVQYKLIGDGVSLQNCTSDSNACNPGRIWETESCFEGTLNPSQFKVICTEIDRTVCEVPLYDGVFTGKPSWNNSSYTDQAIVDCQFKAKDFLVCQDGTDTCFNGESEVDVDVSYEKIQAWIEKYGNNSYGAQNIQSLNDNVLSWACFLPVENQCRIDSINVDPSGVPLTSPMKRCSMINSATQLGALCNDWYKTYYGPAMEVRVSDYCCRYGTNSKGQPVFPENPEWNDGTISQDCTCVLRWGNETYVDLRKYLGVAYNDACWFKPCLPDSPQLKPDQTMLNPTCPTQICQNIINTVTNVENSSDVDVNWNINAYVNCNDSGSSSFSNEQTQTKFKNSYIIMLIVILIIVVFAVVVIIFI